MVLADISLLLLAPLLNVAIVHRKKGLRWLEPVATVLLAVTVVLIGMALSGGNAAPAVAIPAPQPFLSPQGPPDPACTYPNAPITGTRVISYTYDPLGRLTSASYSSRECYRYGYDKVGNRTAATQTITSTVATSYGAGSLIRTTPPGCFA